MPNINVDLIGRGGAQGDVASRVYGRGFDVGMLKPFIGRDGRSYISVFKGGDPKDPKNYETRLSNYASTLRKDEWKQLDEAVVTVVESRLTGVQDLINRGLVYNLGNAMGTTVLEWDDMSSAFAAELTMDAVTRGNNDRVVFQRNYLPIPIIHVDYELNARELAASRNLGRPLDTIHAERAARAVQLKLEQMTFTNTTYAYGDKDDRGLNSIYSLVNHPDRNQVTLGVGWDDSSTTSEKIVADVKTMLQTARDAYYGGPYVLYIPLAYQTAMDDDYDKTGKETVRDRIMKLGGVSDIVVVDTLATDNVLLVQTTPDVVRIVRGMGITNVEWGVEGNFLTKYKVLTIQVPQVRSDQNGASGIVHLA